MLGRTQQACRYSLLMLIFYNQLELMCKQATVTKEIYFIFTHISTILGGSFQIFRLCMVHVKNSTVCGLAYSKAYIAIFLADACRLKCVGLQAQSQES